MKLNLRVSIRLLALSLWFVVSCRNDDYEEEKVTASSVVDENSGKNDDSSEKTVQVKINFIGVEQNNNYGEIISKKSYSLNNEPISYTQVFSDGSGAAEVEKKSTFAVNNADFPNGTRYKMLVYKKDKDKNLYTFDKQQNFVVGDKNSQIELTRDQYYTLIVVSTGTGILPSVLGESDFNSVRFVVNQYDINSNVFYQKIENYIPSGDINIKLEDKTTRVKIDLDSSDIMGGGFAGSGRSITYVANAKISYKRPKQVELRLCDAIQIVSAESQQVDLEIDTFGDVNSTLVSSGFVNNIIINEYTEPVFSVTYKADSPKENNISMVLKGFKNGGKQDFTIKLRGCGAYLGPNKTNWKTFMCHNLGADYSRDPLDPSEKIHGDKYQWGMKNPIVKQKDDVYESPRKSGWNRTRANGTWNRGEGDPCPDGWRVPTSGEWTSVLNNNKGVKLGNWNASTLKVDNAGVKLGDDLMLPAAGKRFEYGNTINSDHIDYWHATMTTVWSSTESDDRAFSAVIFKHKSGRDQYEVTRDYKKLDALPVRCIKKD